MRTSYGVFCFVALMALTGASPGSADEQKIDPAKSMRLITLGTAGGPFPHVERSQPANALIVNGQPYLIDAGNGVLRQLTAAKVRYNTIDQIFITHHHDDHNADLGAVMGASWDSGRKSPIYVYGPPGTVETISGFLMYFHKNAEIRTSDVARPDPASIFIGHDVQAPGSIYKDANVTVTAVENTHFAGLKPGTPAYGKDKSYAYRFASADRVIVFTGDTGPSEAVTELAKGADILVSEVIDPKGISRLIKSSYVQETDEQLELHVRHFLEDHLVPEEIGKMAAKAGVKMVVLTHIVPGSDGEHDDTVYSAGVKMHFNGPVEVAKDLMSF